VYVGKVLFIDIIQINVNTNKLGRKVICYYYRCII